MKKKEVQTKMIAQLIDEQFGKKGIAKRKKFDEGYQDFKSKNQK